MRKIYLVFAILFSSNFYAQENTPKQVVEEFFNAFHAKDTTKMRAVLHKEVVFQTVINTSKIQKLETENVSDFMLSIASIPENMKFEEKILEYEVKIDGNLAHVWTPYEFFINEKLSHIGANSFTLYNDNGNWLIIYLIDTRRKKSL